MKRILCLMTILMLIMPVTARADMAGHAESGGAVYKLEDANGAKLASIAARVYLGDEYISGDDRLYRVVAVDDVKRTAFVEYEGPEDMTGLSEGAVEAMAFGSNRLIAMYSTHSDESYLPSDGADSKLSDAGIHDVSEALKAALTERGIEVILDTTTHFPHDAGAYRRSRVTAERLVQKRPAALLDIHRDGIPDPKEYAYRMGGEDVTKIRLLVGRSNPNSEVNRRFAKQIKQTADNMYPKLIKDIFIGKGDYNQELMPRAILLEFGTHTTEKERAIASTQYMADVLEKVLFGTTAQAEGGGMTQADAVPAPPSQSAGSGAMWGILIVAGIAAAGIVIYGLVSTGSFSGMWAKIKRGASETTGGLFGQKPDGKK